MLTTYLKKKKEYFGLFILIIFLFGGKNKNKKKSLFSMSAMIWSSVHSGDKIFQIAQLNFLS